MKFVSGNLTVPGSLPLNGNATVEMFANGDWVFTPHAHDSGASPIAYGLNAVVVTPSGRPFAFQRAGIVSGGAGNDDPPPLRGNDPAISDNWGGILAAMYSPKIDGKDTWFGVRQALEDLVQQTLQAALQAAEHAVEQELVTLVTSLAS